MAKPKNKGKRAIECSGRVNRGTKAHEIMLERRIAAAALYDAALDELAGNHAGEVLSGNAAQKLATKVAQEMQMSRGPLQARSRIAIVDRAVNAHNAQVKEHSEQPRKYRGEPVRTLETYANSNKNESPLVRINEKGHAALLFPGMPPIRLYTSQQIPLEQPTYATVSFNGKQIKVSLIHHRDQIPLPQEGQWDPRDVLGIDAGITDIIASSAGISYQGISQRKMDAKIRRAQRHKQAMVRRAIRAGLAGYKALLDENNRQTVSEKGVPRRYLCWFSGEPNREYVKAAQRISRLCKQRAKQRRAYRHQVSAQTIKHCAANGISLIALEKLQVRNMSKSDKGTADSPGRNVAQKRGLNRRILEQGWAELARFIKYKARALGIRTVRVNPAGTSQTCPVCGNRDQRARKGKLFHCVVHSCGHQDDADNNGATNIGDKGTYIYLKREGATMDSIRRDRLARSGNKGPLPQTPATGTDDASASLPADAPHGLYRCPTPAQLSNSSQPSLPGEGKNAGFNFAIV